MFDPSPFKQIQAAAELFPLLILWLIQRSNFLFSSSDFSDGKWNGHILANAIIKCGIRFHYE